MKRLKEKDGISLIVLILTIIIMIILATAVILSLNSSGIISKAQNAKEASDKASIKEYKSVLEAEWELMTKAERTETGYSSKEEYVNAKLKEKGYNVEEAEDGWLSVEEAKEVLEIGDVVEYTVTSKTEPSQAADNGYGLQNVSNQTNLTWRYIGVSDNGKIMIAPDVTSDAPQLTLYGKVGYLKGPAEIKRLCQVLYTTDKGTAQSMTIEDVIKLLGYTGEKGAYYDSNDDYQPTAEPLTIQQIIATKGESALANKETPDGEDNIETYLSDGYYISKEEEDDVKAMTYPEHRQYVYYGTEDEPCYYWLASPCVTASFTHGQVFFDVRCVFSSCVSDSGQLFDSIGYERGSNYVGDVALRPVVTLYSNVQLKEVSDGNWKLN